MIIDTNPQHQVESSGELETTVFSIKQSAKAFAVLSSSLYKDKIRSIVRELSSNARDSHVSANKKDVPFDVHLPTAMEPEFWIRDYGTGLSDDGIKNIYTRYFESTKETSNDAVGCLGLGSKSPFAYTSSFMVTSWFGGKKIIYSVFINDFSEPEIAKMLEVETDEPNGLEVRFNVPVAEREKFANAARRVYTWFDLVNPNFVGQKINLNLFVEKKAISDIVVSRYKTGGQVSKCSVVMGEVEYPVDLTNSSVQEISAIKETVSIVNASYNTTISIRVPIGSIDFAPSREDLQYTPKTLSSLKTQFASASKKIEAMLPTFDEASIVGKSYRETYIAYCEYVIKLQDTARSLGIPSVASALVRKFTKRKTDLLAEKLSPHELNLLSNVVIDNITSYSTSYSTLNDYLVWVSGTHILLSDVTGTFLPDYKVQNPDVMISVVNATTNHQSGVRASRIFQADEVDVHKKLFEKLGYTVVLCSDLLTVKLKDRKYHTLYRMSVDKSTFNRATDVYRKSLTDNAIQTYWVKMTNKKMVSSVPNHEQCIEIARIVSMPFNIVGIYEPSSIDVSAFKEFDKHFVKDLDIWMASAPNRNLITHKRISDMEKKNVYMTHDQSSMYTEALQLANIDQSQHTVPSTDDLYTIGSTSQMRTRLSGIDRYFDSVRELKYYQNYILNSNTFPLTAFKDANMFQMSPIYEHIVNFKQHFATLCQMFDGILDPNVRRSAILDTSSTIINKFKSLN